MTDTGPPYPNPPLGANGIGQFKIGLSPIGAIAEYNPWTPIISQYRNSPIIDSMILAFNSAMDQTRNLSNLFDMIWNVQTAIGFGLDVWGRIVGVSRTLNLPGAGTFLGNEEANSWTGFGPAPSQGVFYSGGGTASNFLLNDANFRTLIFAKAAGNISDGSVPSINQILLTLFPNRGACFVTDNQNMSCTLVFKFQLTVVESAILAQSNVLPIPVGVSTSISQLT